jgi:hypothetical protein
LKIAKAVVVPNRFTRLTIYTDSQAVLSSLVAASQKQSGRYSRVTYDILGARQHFLDLEYDVTLHWVKGHSRCQGNNLADKLATLGRLASKDGKRGLVANPFAERLPPKAAMQALMKSLCNRNVVENRREHKISVRAQRQMAVLVHPPMQLPPIMPRAYPMGPVMSQERAAAERAARAARRDMMRRQQQQVQLNY